MKNWKDITLGQFNRIQEVVRTPDEWMQLNLIDIVYGVDTSAMTVLEVKDYAKSLDFLSEPIPEVRLKRGYKLNGRDYLSHFDLTCLSMAQFVDYQNYLKAEPARYEDILSVFFTPKGHDYNDGYDVRQLKSDLLTLDMPTVRSLAFFFDRQLSLFLSLFHSCSMEEIKGMRTLSEKEKENILRMYKEQDFASLVSSLISSQSARRQTRRSRQ